MKVEILDIDRLISVNKLKEVTSTKLFSSKLMYDPEGILSTDIFGTSKGDRRNTYAYIDLHRKFIHPHIYGKVLKSINKNIVFLVGGQRKFTIRDGNLVEDENGWTGIEALYNHWEELDWVNHRSSNQLNKQVLYNLTKDQIFIDKWIVCPPAYRDVVLSGTVDYSDHVHELNTLYQTLLQSIAVLSEGGIFARAQYATQLKIQNTLVDILEYFKGQVAKKQGLIRKNLIGKAVDYGVRAVISAPTYDNETLEDQMVDIEHTAVPIELCCSAFYPFIEAWLKNFFTREVINNSNQISFYDEEAKHEITATIDNPEIQFSEKNIRKMINNYELNPDNRFSIIKVNVKIPMKGKDASGIATLRLKGKVILENQIPKELDRPLTITDVLYLACVDSCEKRHIMTSRYPVGTDKGIFFSYVRVQSTARHIKLVYNGKEYPYYPDIDLKIDHDKVGVQFVDTLVMHNAHLDGMGADLTKPQSWSAMAVMSYKNKLVNA